MGEERMKYQISSSDGTNIKKKINGLVAYVNKTVNSPAWPSEKEAIEWAEKFLEDGIKTLAGNCFADKIED
jgi:hypothetical protein